MHNATAATLLLDDGSAFPGVIFGATPSDAIAGDLTFTTDMFGYQKQLTDPARAGQILVFAAPQVGNVGWNAEDSATPDGAVTVTAVVVRDLSRTVSNFRAERSLEEELQAQGITGLAGVDTRKLVRHLAAAGGSMRGQVIVEKQTA